jgi:PIN domain nuclease of toxin-antitoxin system
MKLLLDTHAFIWWDSDPGQLSARALAALRGPANEVLLSVCSVWEMAIKADLGKLPLADIVAEQRANGLKILPIALEHTLAVIGLPPLHKSPFDRLLVTQTNIEGAEMVTSDPVIRQYPVRTLW